MRLDKLIDALSDPNMFMFKEVQMTVNERNRILEYLDAPRLDGPPLPSLTDPEHQGHKCLVGATGVVPPQLFDFGLMTDKHMVSEASVILEPMYEGFVRLPAPVCVFKRDWFANEHYASNHGLQELYDPDSHAFGDKEWLAGGNRKFTTYTVLYEAYAAMGSAAELNHITLSKEFEGIGYHNFTMSEQTGTWFWDGTRYDLEVMGQAAQVKWHLKRTLSVASTPAEGVDIFTKKQRFNNSFRTVRHVLACLARLTGVGMERETYVAPLKLNKSRIKKGKTPLSDFTKVRIAPYRAPLGHSGPHDEVSRKRFHFRRGHIRHFQNGETTWVRHALVGNREDGEVTHEYEVRT